MYEWFSDSNFDSEYHPTNNDTMTDISANKVLIPAN